MKSETRSFYETAVRRAVERVVDGLDESLELAAIARLAALSPLHFHRIFRFLVGETPLELHRRLRLERAAAQLATGEAAVTRIAFDAGYETHESFTRAFGDRYGTSPSAFRASAVSARSSAARPPQIELAARSGLHFRPGERPEPILTTPKGASPMNVEVKEMPALRLAALRHVGPYSRISETFQRLGEIAARAGLERRADSALLALFHDDPETTPVEQLRSDAAVTIPNRGPVPAGLTEIRLPAGRYATTTHLGPYTELGDVWARLLGGWLPESGYRGAETPSFELYRNDPSEVPPDKLRTELYLPLA